jgi:chitin synthase
MLDPAFVQFLRNSRNPFVSNLLSRLSLAAETHNKDETMVILTEVSSRLLRQPSSIASQVHPRLPIPNPLSQTSIKSTLLPPSSTTPSRSSMPDLIAVIYGLYMSCIQHNDSSSSNLFDKRRVRLRSDPSISPNLSVDGASNTPPTFELAKFRDSYVRDHEARVEFGVDSSMCGGE